ncbi:MAG: DNA polymerase III subunit delta' [Coriobacteriia bacterium]|nr:DNA polymerase III subunit delta' [Coriobacteriia bacterium]
MARCVFDDLVGQERVAQFLRTAVEGDHVSHAYLFVGPAGSGKATAARSLACALLCADDGCGACEACARVRRGVHPDVHEVAPEGAAGYLAEQVRDIIRDVNLSPIDGPRKVYIVSSADLFNDSSANAFLKTLEEPPDDVVIILMAHSFDAVMPTIVSRCQVVRFRRIPPREAAAILVARTGADADEAASALAAAGGVVARARDFLASPLRREARASILRILGNLCVADGLDVLGAARDLLTAVRAPLEDVKTSQAAALAERADFLGKGATKASEDKNKRELTAREREGVGEILNIAESWLRDCLVVVEGAEELVVNTDAIDAIREVCADTTSGALTAALGAVNVARRRISYNVNLQLAIEAMLFDIREVLRCPR